MDNLLGGDAGEAEHADLLGDVVPGQRVAHVLQVLAQQRAHCDDAVRHPLHLVIPPAATPHCLSTTLPSQLGHATMCTVRTAQAAHPFGQQTVPKEIHRRPQLSQAAGSQLSHA